MTPFKKFQFRIFIPLLVSITKSIFGSRNSEEPNAENFLFIIGSGRNGSTLLSAVLNNSPQIFIPPEQYVLPFYAYKWQVVRGWSKKTFFLKLTRALLKKNKTSNWILESEDYKSLEDDINNSFFRIIERIFQLYAKKVKRQNMEILGENSPLNTHFLKLIIPEFPKAKFVFLIRDPRAVIYSFSTVPNHEANDLHFAIWKWKDSVIQYKKLKKSGAYVQLLKYEDLVTDPAIQLENIYHFLGIQYPKDLLNHGFSSAALGVSDLEHHKNLSNPINNKSIDKWRGRLSDKDLKIIQGNLSDYAKEFGYDLYD